MMRPGSERSPEVVLNSLSVGSGGPLLKSVSIEAPIRLFGACAFDLRVTGHNQSVCSSADVRPNRAHRDVAMRHTQIGTLRMWGHSRSKTVTDRICSHSCGPQTLSATCSIM